MRRHMMKYNLLILLVIGVLASSVFGAPVDPKKKDEEKNDENKVDNADDSLDEYGLEYGRYLQQVVQALEEDKEFAKKLENVTADQIRSGQIAKELEFVNHKVRNKLDELKRMELERLRKLARQEMERNDLGLYRDQNGHLAPIPPDGRRWRTIPRNRWGSDSDDDDEDDDGFGDPWLGLDRKNIKMPQHLNVRNPSTFEVEDLMHLIKTATRDLEKLDQKRREEFKKYEMEKEHKYRESLKNMNEEERKAAVAKHEEMLKKHKEHPKVHHPGSKPQLEEVWEEQDHLPKEEFDPKTFFALHDVNGDGYLDEQEVEAILSLEIKKMYDPNNAEDDPVEMMEEYNRMREHIYKEADTNKDGLISRKEFDDMVKRADFEQDEGWKGLDEQTVYTDEEFREYERQLQMQQYGYPQPPTHPYGGGGGYPPQQQPYHGVPQQEMPPHHQAGVPMNQQGVPHHQQGVPYGMPQQGIQQGVHPAQYQQQGVPIQQYQAVPQGQQYQAVPMQHHQQQQQHQAIPQQQQQQQQQQHYGAGVGVQPQHQPHPNQIGAGSLPQQAHPPVPQAGASQQAPPNFQGQQGGNAQHPIPQQQQQQQPQVQNQQIPQQQQQQQQQPQKHS